MIKIDCDICGVRLMEQGALIWLTTDVKNLFEKVHVCVKCQFKLRRWLTASRRTLADGVQIEMDDENNGGWK